MVTVLVDARNVQRSVWPNLTDADALRASQRWAAEHGVDAEVVFDGRSPAGGIGTGVGSADDWIARRAAELADAGSPYWLVTSDRELRTRAGRTAQRVIGGGTFARELQERR
jgi:hypothetical protein